MRAINNNIKILYAMSALQNALLFIGVLYPFLQKIGVSTMEYFILQGFFSLIILLAEIPSGYLSDRWGRKPTLILGSILACVGVSIYALSHNFWHFLVGEMFMALAYSCYSGTLEAMTFDTLLQMDRKEQYRKIAGRFFSIGFIANALGSIAGGIIAVSLSLRLVMWTTIPFLLGALVASLFLVEPSRHKLQEKRHIAQMLKITKITLGHRSPLRSVMLISTVLSSMTLALVWFTQPYQELIEFPLAFFGIPHAAALILGAFLSQIAPRLEKIFDDRLMLISIVSIVIASYVTIGFLSSLLGLIIIVIGRTTYGALMPLTSDLINRMTESNIRATVLSVRSMLEKLFFALASPLIGYMTQVYTLNQAMLLTGILGGLISIIMMIRMTKVWAEIPS